MIGRRAIARSVKSTRRSRCVRDALFAFRHHDQRDKGLCVRRALPPCVGRYTPGAQTDEQCPRHHRLRRPHWHSVKLPRWRQYSATAVLVALMNSRDDTHRKHVITRMRMVIVGNGRCLYSTRRLAIYYVISMLRSAILSCWHWLIYGRNSIPS